MYLVTFDLDSTLCDTGHRHVLIDRVNGTDWNAYSKACINDSPILASVTLLNMLHGMGAEIHFVTGRTEAARPETEEWLEKVFPHYAGLWMDDTPNGDHFAVYGGHAAYKVARVMAVANHVRSNVDLHVDDWAEVKVALEAVGIPCLCVRTPEEIMALTEHAMEPSELR